MVVLNCAHIEEPCIQLVDCICRLRLGLKRAGLGLRLTNVGDDLLSLMDLCGLGVDVDGQPKEREEPGGVQEEGDLPDPPL